MLFMKKNLLIFLAIIFIFSIFIIAEVYDVTDVKEKINNSPLLQESDTYNISSNEPGPKIYKATFAPLGGAVPGALQRALISVRYDAPVDSVDVNMIMDNGLHPISLELKEGTAEDGAWEGSWVVKDTHNAVYQAEILAKSGEETSRVVLSFQSMP
jgi:hypothetical protein